MDKSNTFTTTQATYTVVTEQEKRVTRFENGQAIWENLTRFNILRDGENIFLWTYQEDEVESSIKWYEMKEANPGFEAHMSSRFD